MAVHHFERLVDDVARPLDLRVPHRFATVLAASPLSYDGEIVKVCWCVRLRLFLPQGQESVAETPFRLGNVALRRDWGLRNRDWRTMKSDLTNSNDAILTVESQSTIAIRICRQPPSAARQSVRHLLDHARRTRVSLRRRTRAPSNSSRKLAVAKLAGRDRRPARQRQIHAARNHSNQRSPRPAAMSLPSHSTTASAACRPSLMDCTQPGSEPDSRSSSSTATSNSAGSNGCALPAAAAAQTPACSSPHTLPRAFPTLIRLAPEPRTRRAARRRFVRRSVHADHIKRRRR